MLQRFVRRCFWFAVLAVGLSVLPVTAEDWPRWRGPRGDGTWQGPQLPEKWPEGGLKTAWKRNIGGGYGGISIVGSRLYVMDCQKEPNEIERVHCFNSQTGDSIWSVTYPVSYKGLDYANGPRVTPTIHDGRVYTVGAVGHAHCFDAESGRILWNKDPQSDYQTRNGASRPLP
jgi:outer membrane protein assembly factor BamB